MAAQERLSVLVIDDDADILECLQDALSDHYEVHACNSPVDAVARARHLRPAVIILDVRMPVRDGFWVFREIRKFDTTTPVIMHSGYYDNDLRTYDNGIQGPFAYLHKTGSLHELLNTVSAAAALHSPAPK